MITSVKYCYETLKNMFSDDIYRKVWHFSIPVMIDQLFVIAITTVNLAMNGQIGKIATSCIGLGEAINNLMFNLGLFAAMAGGIIIAQYMGREDKEGAEKVSRQALFFGLIVMTFVSFLLWIFRVPILRLLFGKAENAVLISIIEYMTVVIVSYPFLFYSLQGYAILRATGNSKTPMIINIITAAVDCALGYVLIIGIHHGSVIIGGYGVVGTGITLIIARIIACILVTAAIKHRSFSLKISFKLNYKPEWKVIKKIYSIALPAMLEQMVFMGGKLMIQSFTTLLGTFAVAANNVAVNTAALACVPSVAYVSATSNVVAKAVGTGDVKEVKKAANYAIIQGWIMTVIVPFFFFIFARPITSIYTRDAEVIRLSSHILKTYVVLLSMMQITSFNLPAAFRGAGDAKFAMYVANFNMLAIRIGLGYYFAVMTPIGVMGIWYAMYIDWVVRTILFGRHYLSGEMAEIMQYVHAKNKKH